MYPAACWEIILDNLWAGALRAHCWHLLTSIAIIISVVVVSLGNDRFRSVRSF